jgi:hypothetical protein
VPGFLTNVLGGFAAQHLPIGEAEGLQRSEIARRSGIGVASVYPLLAEAKKAAGDRTVAV